MMVSPQNQYWIALDKQIARLVTRRGKRSQNFEKIYAPDFVLACMNFVKRDVATGPVALQSVRSIRIRFIALTLDRFESALVLLYHCSHVTRRGRSSAGRAH